MPLWPLFGFANHLIACFEFLGKVGYLEKGNRLRSYYSNLLSSNLCVSRICV